MAVIRYSTFDKTVQTIVDRNNIVNRVDGMTVVVLDAISDINAGPGKAVYRWESTSASWIMISKESVDTISFATEELTIVNGKVTPTNIILDNQIWNIDIINGSLIMGQPRIEDLTIDYTGISGLTEFNGNKLRFTYAYGTVSAQMSSIISDLEARIDSFEAGLPTKDDLNALQIDAGTLDGKDSTYFQPALVSGTSIKTVNDSDITGTGNVDIFGNVHQDIIPNANSVYNIGSTTNRFKGIYVDEAYLSANTLYIGDTPVMGTEQETIVIKADVGQSITMQTKGLGVTNITSENEVSVNTSGVNADIVVQATGVNSKVKLASLNAIEMSGPTFAQNDLSVSGNLTVTGNLIANGSQFTVNATTVTTKDNIITLNQGEVGTGVTAGKAGIQIDRGDASDYQLVFDEVTDKFVVGQVGGTFETLATREFVSSEIIANKHTTLSGYGITDAYTKTETDSALNLKVDKVAGKGLSTEDYTTAEKTKLAGLSNYVKPTSEPISYIDGLQTALNSKVDDYNIGTSEYNTGIKRGNKEVFGIEIDLGLLPNSASKDVAFTFNSAYIYWIDASNSYASSSSEVITLPYLGFIGDEVSVKLDRVNNKIVIIAAKDRTSLTGKLVILYTK